QEIHNRWLHAINTRLKFDKILTDTSRFKKNTIKETTVLRTVGIFHDSCKHNWIHQTGVKKFFWLAPRRPPGRNR
ncbi:hypothetical protein K503DRAFT_725709, partial [Rhizopogon vinicolor AM-OR11-026]